MINKVLHISLSNFEISQVLQSVVTDSIKTDSSQIDIRYFKENISDRYPGDEFNYAINDTGGVNLMQRVLSKFFGWLRDIFGIDIDFVDYKTLEYIIYGILSIIVIYVIIKYLRDNPINTFIRSEITEIDNFSFTEETLDHVNFDKLVSDAIEQSNYRLATRYLYLKTLRELTKNKLIEWHFDKTNTDYLNEIKDDSIKKLFKRISYIYDYIWYGEFPIDEASYQKNRLTFSEILKQTANG